MGVELVLRVMLGNDLAKGETCFFQRYAGITWGSPVPLILQGKAVGNGSPLGQGLVVESGRGALATASS